MHKRRQTTLLFAEVFLDLFPQCFLVPVSNVKLID